MGSIRNVCVYCGSGDGNDPRFVEAAEAFGKALAAEGIGRGTAHHQRSER